VSIAFRPGSVGSAGNCGSGLRVLSLLNCGVEKGD
jgi:hypothetical protein